MGGFEGDHLMDQFSRQQLQSGKKEVGGQGGLKNRGGGVETRPPPGSIFFRVGGGVEE